jgi:hypothetical protein
MSRKSKRRANEADGAALPREKLHKAIHQSWLQTSHSNSKKGQKPFSFEQLEVNAFLKEHENKPSGWLRDNPKKKMPLNEKENQTIVVLASVLVGGCHKAWSETLAHAFNVSDRSITRIVCDGFEHAFDGAPKEEKSDGSLPSNPPRPISRNPIWQRPRP